MNGRATQINCICEKQSSAVAERRPNQMKLPVPPPGFDELPVEAQIEYVQALWGRIAAAPDRVPVPSWHLKLIDERRDDLEANPDDAVSWDEVRAELQAKLQRRR